MSLTFTTEATGVVAEACKGDYTLIRTGVYQSDVVGSTVQIVWNDDTNKWDVQVLNYGVVWTSPTLAGEYSIGTTGLVGPAMDADALVTDNDPQVVISGDVFSGSVGGGGLGYSKPSMDYEFREKKVVVGMVKGKSSVKLMKVKTRFLR